MPAEPATSFLQVLTKSPLLDPRQREEVVRVLRARFPQERSLAQELLKRGWLTPYQANRLLQGRGSELFLGPYVVLERLGEGGMGEVFKARHPTMDRIVALKRIRKERLANPVSVQRFYQEVRAAARLQHPNVVYALDTFQFGDTHLLVMEYVEGKDLARIVKESGPLDVLLACNFIRQAALGLQHAHERGLIHRDIKPHNLLVASATGGGTQIMEATLKILDMGLARLIDNEDDTAALTQEGAVMGTPDYISPEQARQSRTLDIRSDLYSLGCTLYFMLTGRPPFTGGTMAEKLLKHAMDEPEPVAKVRKEVPPPVAAVVHRLMAKKPEDRFQTPRELADALAAILNPDQVQYTDPRITALPASAAPSTQRLVRGPDRLPDVIAATPHPAETVSVSGSFPRPTDRLTKAHAVSIAQTWLMKTGVLVLNGMRRFLQGPRWLVASVSSCIVLLLAFWLFWPASGEPVRPSTQPGSTRFEYVKKATREETILAILQANGWPTLHGKWFYIGPFDDSRGAGFQTVYPPEKEIDLAKTYAGKDGQQVGWKEYLNFPISGNSRIQGRALFGDATNSCAYLYTAIETQSPRTVPVQFNYQDSIKVWLNGKQILSLDGSRDSTTLLQFQPGINHLLIKLGGRNGWGISLHPQLSPELETAFGLRLQLDFLMGPVLEGESLKILGKSSDFPASPQDMRPLSSSWWRGSSQLQVLPTRNGEWVDLELPIIQDRRYQVIVYLTKAKNHGIIQFNLQGQPLGGRIDLYHPDQTINSGPIELGTFSLKRGTLTLRGEVVGTNGNSVGERYGWGLDCILLR